MIVVKSYKERITSMLVIPVKENNLNLSSNAKKFVNLNMPLKDRLIIIFEWSFLCLK